ncbi:unnamed protein product, partial [marine sediment metagenome]
MKLCEKADECSEDIIRDINDGTLSSRYAIEPGIRKVLARGLRPNPKWARYLQKARERRGGALKPADYWPDLGLIGAWKGGTVGHYLDKFPEWFDPDGTKPVPVRDWGYLSSEFRGSVPLSDEGSRGVLTVATNLYEFVAVDELESKRDDSSAWRFLTVGEIEQGKEYYVFVSTTAGLYRYDINDVVQVTGTYNATPQIVFLRKGRGMTNITGEKLSVNQVIQAFQKVSQDTGIIPTHFKAEADADSSRYVFRAEFVLHPDSESLKKFLVELDEVLQGINIEYKSKRESMRLAA